MSRRSRYVRRRRRRGGSSPARARRADSGRAPPRACRASRIQRRSRLLGTPTRWSSAKTVLAPPAMPCDEMPVGGSSAGLVTATMRVPSAQVRRSSRLSASPANQSSLWATTRRPAALIASEVQWPARPAAAARRRRRVPCPAAAPAAGSPLQVSSSPRFGTRSSEPAARAAASAMPSSSSTTAGSQRRRPAGRPAPRARPRRTSSGPSRGGGLDRRRVPRRRGRAPLRRWRARSRAETRKPRSRGRSDVIVGLPVGIPVDGAP